MALMEVVRGHSIPALFRGIALNPSSFILIDRADPPARKEVGHPRVVVVARVQHQDVEDPPLLREELPQLQAEVLVLVLDLLAFLLIQ